MVPGMAKFSTIPFSWRHVHLDTATLTMEHVAPVVLVPFQFQDSVGFQTYKMASAQEIEVVLYVQVVL